MKALPNQSRAVQCEGKEAFSSYKLAMEVSGRKTRRTGDRGLNAYKCPHCPGNVWHIGHHRTIKKPRFYGDE